MNFKHSLSFSCGLVCYGFAIAMFWYFPGVAAWTLATLHPLADLQPSFMEPRMWINLLMAMVVFLPGLLGPLLLITRARQYVLLKLVAGCLCLSALYFMAGMVTPLLYGRVALIALLSGQLLALGWKFGASVPYNWMMYLAFILAYFTFPDDQILAGANFLAGVYLLVAGFMIFFQARNASRKKPGYRVMVG